jgi:hypothetical protein
VCKEWGCSAVSRGTLELFMGVFVTREHVRHNKSGIAHRGRTRINHLASPAPTLRGMREQQQQQKREQ